MLKIRLADLNIHIDNKYEYLNTICSDYLYDGDADFCVSVTDEEIAAEGNSENFGQGYLECLAVYRKIAEKMPDYDGFLMHGAVISFDGSGIAFLAKSGTGKTTHMQNWLKLYGDKITVVNGDKPLIRVIDNRAYAYGTPWAGKENIGTNSKVQLRDVCFIERSANNECKALGNEVLKKLISQIYIPRRSKAFVKILDLLDKFIEKTGFYVIRCNTDAASAEVAFNQIILKNNN